MKFLWSPLVFISFFIQFLFMENTHARHFNVLVMPAGGATNVMPLVLLENIEAELGKHITEVVDEIWGTSAGGLNAALLGTYCLKKENEVTQEDGVQRKRTAQEAICFYDKVFPNTFWGWFKSYKIRSFLREEIGQDTLIEDTCCKIRILTAAKDSENDSKWKPYGFCSDGNGECTQSKVRLGDIVSGSCTVPYLFFKPTAVCTNLANKDDIIHCIDPASWGAFAAADPTPYFLKGFLERLGPDDTATIYYLANAFSQNLNYTKISKILDDFKNTQQIQSYQFSYYDGEYRHLSFQELERPQVQIVRIPMNINRSKIISQYWKKSALVYSTIKTLLNKTTECCLNKTKCKSLKNFEVNLEKNLAANFLGLGGVPLATLKEEAKKTILFSKNFKEMLKSLKEHSLQNSEKLNSSQQQEFLLSEAQPIPLSNQ